MSYREAILVETIESMKSRLRESAYKLDSVGKTEKGVLERGLASKTFAEVLKVNHIARGMKR